MPEPTLHLVAVLTDEILPAFRAVWSPGDAVFVLSRQAKSVLAATELPFAFLGEGQSPYWEGLHGAVQNRLSWPDADARWDWEPFLLHETTRDFLLCDSVFGEIQRHSPRLVRWWNLPTQIPFAEPPTGSHPFTAVETLLGRLSIPVLRGSSNERANLLP